MFEVTVRSFFSAARKLEGSKDAGKLHGQTFEVEVAFQRAQLDEIGVVADYWELKEKVDSFLKKLDHTYLNELDWFNQDQPTTERICKFLASEFQKNISEAELTHVKIKDTPFSEAAYFLTPKERREENG